MSTTLGYIECISLWCLSPLGSHGITTKPKNTTGFVLAKCSSRHRTLLVQSIHFVHTYIFEMDRRAFGSTPTSGRAVQQKVEGRFNHGVNFFDAFCHQDGVSLFVWTQQLHHTMTSCAQSTFTFCVCNVMQCFAAWVCSCDGLCRTQIPRNSLFKLHAGTAGTVQPLDWTFTWNAIYAEQVWSWLRAGAWPFLHASWSCFEELCGRAFSTAYVTSLCLRSVSGSAVWIQTWRAPCPHSDTTRFWPSFQWISAPVCLCLQPAKFYGFTEFSLKCWIRWKFATLSYTNCPGRLAALWQSLIMSMCHMRTAMAWTVTEVHAWDGSWMVPCFVWVHAKPQTPKGCPSVVGV